MSAPWASMWVAQEWRSTWGMHPVLEPAARPAFEHPQTPWRVSRPPRAFRNTASASPRRRHGRGSIRGRPPGPSQASRARRGVAAHGHQPFLVALAEHPDEPRCPTARSDRLSPASSETRAPCRTGPRGWPGPAGPAGPSWWSCRGADRPRPRRWPWEAARGTRARRRTSAVGSRRAVTFFEQEAVQAPEHRGRRATEAGLRAPRHAGAARWSSTWPRSGVVHGVARPARNAS